jgi:hypothetical protein
MPLRLWVPGRPVPLNEAYFIPPFGSRRFVRTPAADEFKDIVWSYAEIEWVRRGLWTKARSEWPLYHMGVELYCDFAYSNPWPWRDWTDEATIKRFKRSWWHWYVHQTILEFALLEKVPGYWPFQPAAAAIVRYTCQRRGGLKLDFDQVEQTLYSYEDSDNERVQPFKDVFLHGQVNFHTLRALHEKPGHSLVHREIDLDGLIKLGQDSIGEAVEPDDQKWDRKIWDYPVLRKIHTPFSIQHRTVWTLSFPL